MWRYYNTSLLGGVIMENVLKDVVAYKPSTYNLLKIKPDSRLTGTFYSSIIKVIYSLYKPLNERFSQETISKYNSNVQVQMNNPVTYEIMFNGDNKKTTPIFCFGIPEDHSLYVKQRIQGILPQSTLTFEDDYASEFDNSYVVEYNYEKDSMLALKTSDNNFLQMMLNLKNDINKGEKILFQVEMTPISNMWKSFQDEKWDKIRAGKDVATKRGLVDKGLDVINNTINEVLSVVDDIMEYDTPKKDKSSKSDRKEGNIKMSEYSTSSRTKKSDDGFSVRIRAYIVCASKMTAKSYATSIETCMRELEENNRLIQGSIKIGGVKRGFNVKSLIPINRNIMNGKELASIVNIPNQKLQREFKIDSINVKQVSAPKECMDSGSGVRCGILFVFGEEKYTYFPKDKNFLAMPKIYIAGMGSGKSTALLNYANDVVSSGQSLIDINFVSKCELAYAIKDMHTNHIIVDLSNDDNLPSFMLPEIRIPKDATPVYRRKRAGHCATEIEYFINSITSKGTESISTRMGQYLASAAKIVFIYDGMKIQTVFDILDDKRIRDAWINKAIESGVYTEESYEIRKLRDLDEDKKGNLVSGVLDRYSELMRHETFQQMLDSDNPQFNFIDIMDQNKSISICMPEDEFPNKSIKDVIITFIMCRIRLAMLARADRDKIVHVLIDEAHHLKNSLDVISDSIAEPRKYGVAFCFCTHYFNQLGDRLKEAMLNVGGHYLLLKGVGESSYNELKAKIGEDWTYEDIKEMDDYNSFNMIWIRSQHYIFVTKMLPPPLDRNGKKYIQ